MVEVEIEWRKEKISSSSTANEIRQIEIQYGIVTLSFSMFEAYESSNGAKCGIIALNYLPSRKT